MSEKRNFPRPIEREVRYGLASVTILPPAIVILGELCQAAFIEGRPPSHPPSKSN
jgi:hypothetical protein